ncbi:MAG: ABC transporter ATP-binding protein [Ruminococcaceae bacterium]|nr:ABC transporter ATP-binding protein [Oscillospiraceae bacterium]
MIRLLSYLKTIKKPVIAAMIFAVISQLGSLVLPLMMSSIINEGIANGDIDYIKNMGLGMMGVSALAVIIACFNSYYSSKTATFYGKILRRELFLKVEGLSQRDIDVVGTPSLITRCTNDVKVLQDFVLMGLRMIISAPIMLVGGVIMAFVMNPGLASIIFGVLPIIAVVVVIVLKVVMPLFRRRQKLIDSINRFIREKLSGIRVIRAFNRTEYEDERFNKQNTVLSSLTLKFQRLMSVLIPVCIVIIIAALDLLIIFAAKNLDKMDIVTQREDLLNAIGNLQAFVIYMVMIVFSVTMAAAMFVIVPRARISAKRIIEVLDLEATIAEPEKPQTVDESRRGEVEFRNVTFRYLESEEPILSDVSFVAEKNKVTAIIGCTGSGKSSLVNLIPRFYDVNDGQVLFDGVDVRELSQKDLRSRIGYIPQKAFLFSGTVEDNLRYGDSEASEQELEKALEIAQCDFVSELEGGMKAFVSQNATNFSGGQKQRLSIARALARKAEVYIFDDSFSALDFKTDAALRKAIRENLDATVIIVAQRVGTILDADKIIVLEGGKVVGSGRHAELIETCDVYKEIYSSQITEEDA